MRISKNTKIARAVIAEILDKGLKDSTFRDNYAEAYESLLLYRRDMEDSVSKVLKRHKVR